MSLLTRFKQWRCAHAFIGRDMQPRNAAGIVRWPCCRCGKVFEAENGLEILKHGTCLGGWGEPK